MSASQFIYYRTGGYAAALAACKRDLEVACRYELVATKGRETKTTDAKGDLFEVFVTFEPLHPREPEPPTTSLPQPADGTQVR